MRDAFIMEHFDSQDDFEKTVEMLEKKVYDEMDEADILFETKEGNIQTLVIGRRVFNPSIGICEPQIWFNQPLIQKLDWVIPNTMD